MKHLIKDQLGRVKGWIEDRGDIREAFDALGRKQATYERKANITKDVLGRMSSTGDTLATFIG